MADYHEANDEANKAILQELAEKSGDPEISAIISCYSIGATGTDIRKEINKHKVTQLKKCATYLRIPTDGENQKKKPQVITDIMTKINCLLKDLCGVCGDYFNIELQDQPLFSCILCQQGCHKECFEPISTLFRTLDANHRKAMQFVCSSCYSDHSPDSDTEIVINAKKSPIKAKTTNSDELEEEVEEEQHQITTGTPNDSNQSHAEPEVLIDHSHSPASDSSRQINKPICPQYKYGRCLNYDTCKAQYDHPRRCRNWMMFGKCRFSTSCKYHHPKLCFSSLAERKCTNLECKYFHLRYTQRYENISGEVVAEYQPQPAGFPPLPPPSHQQPQQVTRTRQQPPPNPHHQEHVPSQRQVRHQPPAAQDNHFLYDHIKETNATMKTLQNLISALLSNQNNQPPQSQQLPVQNVNQSAPQIHQIAPSEATQPLLLNPPNQGMYVNQNHQVIPRQF